MPNYYPTTFTFGATIANRKQQDKQLKAALDAKEAQQQAENFKTAVANARQHADDGLSNGIETLQKAAEGGATEAQLQQIAQSAMAGPQSYASFLQEQIASAVASGASEQQVRALRLVLNDNPRSYLEQQQQRLDAVLQEASLRTPEGKARAQMVQAQSLADRLGVPVQEVAQAMGIAAAPQKPIEAVGPDGKPGFFNVGRDGAQQVPGITPMPKTGMTIRTTPDGGTEITMGGSGETGGMGKPAQNALEKSIIDSGEGLGRLQEIQQTYQPRFLTYGGKAQALWLMVRSEVNPDSLSAEDQRFLKEFAAFRQNAYDNMNRYIREITGAQMSENEAGRLRKSIPDPENDDPITFKSKMDGAMRQLMLVRARSLYVLRQGVDKAPYDAMTLGDIDSLFNQRTNELTAIYSRESGISGAEARTKALAQATQEFGL